MHATLPAFVYATPYPFSGGAYDFETMINGYLHLSIHGVHQRNASDSRVDYVCTKELWVRCFPPTM
jgi:hypothetical protein